MVMKESHLTHLKFIFSGEIDLKDVYNGAVDLGNKALLKFEEIRQTLVQQATAAQQVKKLSKKHLQTGFFNSLQLGLKFETYTSLNMALLSKIPNKILTPWPAKVTVSIKVRGV